MALETAAENHIPKWYPKFRGRPLYHGNEEALAWALDGVGRAVPFIGSGAFFGTALIRIAKEAAGCATEPPFGETLIPPCDEKIYGIKPSSILTTYTMIVGVSSAALLPVMGAIIDYTPHRLIVGQVVSALFCILLLPQIFLNEDNFFALAMVQVVNSVVGWAQTAITYAYLPELTPDELVLNDYTRSYTMAFFLSMVVYLAIVIGGVSIAGDGDDDILTVRVGMSLAFVVSVALLSLSWTKLFGSRDRMHKLPDDRSLWTAGFVQLWNTSKHIAINYRALKWFYVAIAMSDAGLQALATISVTYLTDTLQFSARENGIAILLILLGSVPGAALSNFVTRKLDPIKSSNLALVALMIVTSAAAFILKEPGQQMETYLIAFVWGIGTGWKWTCDRLVASSIIPDGQDAELMGVFLFSGQCLSWIPPLVFTAINESGVDQRIGLASLNGFFLLSMLCYFLTRGYAIARQEVDRESAFSDRRDKGAEAKETEEIADKVAVKTDGSGLGQGNPVGNLVDNEEDGV